MIAFAAAVHRNKSAGSCVHSCRRFFVQQQTTTAGPQKPQASPHWLPRPLLHALLRLAENGSTILAVGSILGAVSYAISIFRDIEAQVEALEEKMKALDEATEDKIRKAKAEAQVEALEEKMKALDEATEDKIRKAKAEAIKESTEIFVKYNLSRTLAAPRKTNNGAPVAADSSGGGE